MQNRGHCCTARRTRFRYLLLRDPASETATQRVLLYAGSKVLVSTPGQVREIEVENLVEDGGVDPFPDTGVLRRPQAGGVNDRVARARGILPLEIRHLDHVNLADEAYSLWRVGRSPSKLTRTYV